MFRRAAAFVLALSALAPLALAASPTTRPDVPMAAPRANKHLPARQRVRDAKNYYCYYGPNRLAELSHYDVVLLHTPAATPELVRQLKDLGVVTLGYITLGADEAIRVGDGTGPGGKASWYFDKNHDGKPDTHDIWKSAWANSNDPKWRADRLAEAKRLVNDVGFDGLFLDTVDDVTIHPEMFDGMVEMIRSLRRDLPEAPIIMNQSWDLLRTLAADVDGVMLEGFTTSYDWENKRYRRNPPHWDDDGLDKVQNVIEPLRKKHPFQVIVLDYAEPHETDLIQAGMDRAATLGYLHCTAPVGLDDVYHYKQLTARPNPKYLSIQATPETLSVTLDAPRNGFVPGTQVVPSNCFGGYTVDPLVDGIEDRSKLDWYKAEWASAENGQPVWLEIRLPESRAGGTLRIDWQKSNLSRAFTVQTKPSADGPWVDARKITANREAVTNVPLPTEPYRFIRVYQEPGGGSEGRPHLMWMAQIKLLP
jgi:polysaccharide biosynthesis protein PelA